jgi:hypothetical protein
MRLSWYERAWIPVETCECGGVGGEPRLPSADTLTYHKAWSDAVVSSAAATLRSSQWSRRGRGRSSKEEASKWGERKWITGGGVTKRMVRGGGGGGGGGAGALLIREHKRELIFRGAYI